MLVCSLPTPLAKISPIDSYQVKYEDMQHLMFGNATKLVNAVPHRWISTCKVLEEVLRSWEALEKHYLDNEAGGNFPLAVHKTAIEELYSLMKPVALLIKNSQRSGGPTGLSTFIDLSTLQATTLDMEKPLLITVPRKVRLGEADSATAVTKRAASSLQVVTTSTRKMRRDAILKRFFDKRYDEAVFAVPEPSYGFEIAACMSLFLHDLRWLPKFFSSPEEADRVDKHIRTKVVDLMVSMAEGAGTQAEEQPDSDETTSSNKRKRPAGLFVVLLLGHCAWRTSRRDACACWKTWSRRSRAAPLPASPPPPPCSPSGRPPSSGCACQHGSLPRGCCKTLAATGDRGGRGSCTPLSQKRSSAPVRRRRPHRSACRKSA